MPLDSGAPTPAFPFVNSYARLPERFHVRMEPRPVAAPRLLALNRPLAEELGLDPDALAAPGGVAVLAGNRVPHGAEPLAQAYAGHQFGGWVPTLGDGRALLLGEVIDRRGRRHDIQLKGSGPTPFSRRGDGRAPLGPVLREYLVAEAMHHLGVPTTRALAAVATGEEILRERPLPGGVLTRVAASHIRVGTFQYFAARGDVEALEILTAHARARHFPEAEGPLGFFEAVVAAQARLVARWMGLGFVHGVMNTDNMAVSGETIDYGPCAFIDGYRHDAVFSSIDQFGRYAYCEQPSIAAWNLAQLGTCLVPLVDAERARAVRRLTKALERFAELHEAAWTQVFRAKLGLDRAEEGDRALATGLLELMHGARADFTLCFRRLSELGRTARAADAAFLALFPAAMAPSVQDWLGRWRARLAREATSDPARQAAMKAVNPWIIPRNHQIERVIAAAIEGDMAPFERLHTALAEPCAENPTFDDLARPPAPEEAVTRTFCGT